MTRMLSVWLAAVLLGLCEGHNTLFEGYDLSLSGYHLCPGNETSMVSKMASYKTTHTEWRSCGGWLPWKMCEVTLYKTTYRTELMRVTKEVTRCCDGYEQVASYCALSLNRSGEFTAKPGSCPEGPASTPRDGGCELDTDCPGWQKCCQADGISNCTDPQPAGTRGWCFNVTVTLKTGYQMLMSTNKGILNHTRLLQSVVTGALDSPHVSVHYITSWPMGAYRTASSLLIGSPDTLSLSNTKTKLHLLLKHVEEVSSVTVEDVDECSHAGLSSCSPQATCTNTEGSYTCACLPGRTDLNPNNTGVHCQMPYGDKVTDMPPNTSSHHPSRTPCPAVSVVAMLNSTRAPPTNATRDPVEESVTWSTDVTSGPSYNRSETSTAITVSDSSTSSTVSPTSTEPCYSAPLTNIQSSNVTGSSFCVSWSSQSQSGTGFLVVLMQGSEVMDSWETNQTTWEVTGLQPGALYGVTITPCAGQGDGLQLHVKTAAQTLIATTRLTDVEFTADLHDPTSTAYQTLTQSIKEEIHLSLPPDILALVTSGEVRVQITGLSPGSVVVNFTIIFSPGQTRDILNVSSALIASLKNSSKYTVDSNNTSIDDLNECATEDMDCSPRANCTNTWGSYSCACLEGFTDADPSRPGRACEAPLTTAAPTTPSSTPSQTNTDPPTATTTLVTDAPTTPLNTPVATAVTTVPTLPVITTTTTIPPVTPTATTASVTTPIISTTTIPVATTTTTTTTIYTVTTTATTIPVSAGTTPVTTTPISATAPTSTSQSLQVFTATDRVSVECRASAITVTVDRELLEAGQIADAAIYLGLPGCGINGGNATHPQLTVAWDECGTSLTDNSTHYMAQVLLLNSMVPQEMPDGTTMVPQIRLEVPIMCFYRKSVLISAGYGPTGYDMIKDTIMGSGTFHVTVQLLNGTYPLPQNYSLSPDEEVVVEVSLNSSVDLIKVVINKCWATQTSNPDEGNKDVFLENSCALPNTFTTVLENGNSTKSRVSVRIFSFVTLNVIYVHCRIQICIETSSATCQTDCIERTERLSNLIGTTKASCGPFLRSFEASIPETADTLHLVGFSLLGVGLTLLFLGVFITVFFYHRNKIGHYNFSLKPKQENFTYNVFDA